jgi:hypothetical protein
MVSQATVQAKVNYIFVKAAGALGAACDLYRPPAPGPRVASVPKTSRNIAVLSDWPAPLDPSVRLDMAQQFHRIADLDGFDRTYGVFDLAAEAPVEAARHKLVELLDECSEVDG